MEKSRNLVYMGAHGDREARAYVIWELYLKRGPSTGPPESKAFGPQMSKKGQHLRFLFFNTINRVLHHAAFRLLIGRRWSLLHLNLPLTFTLTVSGWPTSVPVLLNSSANLGK